MGQPGDDRSDWPPLAVDIPDDIRELAADVAAYHREQRLLRRRALLDRVIPLRRARRFGLVGPIGVGLLVIVAAVGSLLALLVPNAPSQPRQLDLASQGLAPSGSVGGLLPQSELADAIPGGPPVPARGFRPAVFLLLPAACDCAKTVSRLAGATDAYGLTLILVTAAPSERPALVGLATVPGHGDVAAAYDEVGTLTSAYLPPHATRPTAVLVHADGVVGSVVDGLTPALRLPTLSTLVRPGAPVSLSATG